MSKTIRFENDELDTIVDAVNTMLAVATDVRGDPRVSQYADLTLAIADVQVRCRRIRDKVNKNEQDAEPM